MTKDFNILSLDGGGYKGLFTIACLAEIEKCCGIKVNDYFDLYAGTSTGSIIAVGLAAGCTANEILELYKNIGSQIFPHRAGYISCAWKAIKQFFVPIYDNKILKKELQNFFGNKSIEDVCNRNKYIIVPTLCLSNSQPRIFKTDYKPEYNQHNAYKLADIVLASCSAPTYFPVAKIKHPIDGYYEYFVDGGMFANNPSVCAITEAVGNLNINKDNIKLISIAPPIEKVIIKDEFSAKARGILKWNKDLVSMALAGTSIKDAYITKFLLESNKYLRIILEISKNTPKELDRCSKKIINELEREGRQYVINNKRKIQEFFDVNNFEAVIKSKEEGTNG